MLVKQISVFVENKPGRMAAILDVLAQNNIDISALSIADTTDFGVLRIIVSEAALAKKVLNESGVVVKTTDVIAVSMQDRPGGLAEILNVINDGETTIEYMYAFVGRGKNGAMVVIKANHPERAIKLLEDAGFKTADSANIFG